MGRVGVDFYPLSTGSLVDVRYFDKFLGGARPMSRWPRLASASLAPSSRARAPMRWASLCTRPCALRGRRPLREPVAGFQTPVTFCEIFRRTTFPSTSTAPQAPDLEIRRDEFDFDAVSARLFWATVGGLSAEPSRTATLAALEARYARTPHRPRPRLPRDFLGVARGHGLLRERPHTLRRHRQPRRDGGGVDLHEPDVVAERLLDPA